MSFFDRFKNPKTAEEKKRIRQERLLLILSGVLLGISFPPFPFPFSLLAFVAFIPFLLVIERRETLLTLNKATYLMSFVFSLITLYWVGSWQPESDPFLMAGGIALLLAYPCVMLIASTLYYLSGKIFPKKINLWFFPVYWVLTEYLLTLTDIHFPWILLGHGQVKFLAFIQAADIIGTFGLSLVVFYINVFLYKAFSNYKNNNRYSVNYLVAGVSIFLLFVVYGLIRISSIELPNRKVRVGLIQPDINPWKKWGTGSLDKMVDDYLALSQQAVDSGAQIIFWPETALPVYLMGGNYQNEVDKIYSFLEKNKVTLLSGMPDIQYYFNKEDAPADAKFNKSTNSYYTAYNALIELTPGTRNYKRYGKMKLVPLGEHVPFSEEFSFLADIFKWGVGLGGWNIGKDTLVFKVPVENNLEKDTISVSGLICFESVFPIFVAAFVQRGAEFIAVVTNDSWYGNSSGPYQHKDFAILRAVENRRSVVRAANGGISCIINPLGEIEAETKMFTKDVLVGDVVLNKEKTFYTEHPKIVTAIISIFSLWVVGINILLFIKKKFDL